MGNRTKNILNSTAERIKILRKEKGYTQKELSEMLFKSESAIRMWELGKSEPDLETINKLAEIFGVSADYILGNTEYSTRILEALNIRPINKKRFRMLGEIACGQPIFTNEDYESYIDASADIDADFCLTARGDSMIGARINDGDIVFVKQMDDVPNGDIAAVIIGDEATLKVWHHYKEEQKLVLTPENRRYAPLVFTGHELETVYCLGKAVYFMSKL